MPGGEALDTPDAVDAGDVVEGLGRDSGATMDHSHIPIAVPLGAPAPELSLKLHQDVMTGYNLKLIIRNFAMMPPSKDVADMMSLMSASLNEYDIVEGHAHLYINGTKIQRLYGHDIHLPASLFKTGVNQISESINNHGHMYWTMDERQVLATLYIVPALDKPIKHRFESFPVKSAH